MQPLSGRISIHAGCYYDCMNRIASKLDVLLALPGAILRVSSSSLSRSHVKRIRKQKRSL